MKHTPGPWFQEHRKKSNGMYSTEVFDKDGQTIATLAWHSKTIGNVTSTDREANAQLIAAAPDLLAALNDVVTIIENYANAPDLMARLLTWLPNGCAAIAKAEATND